ncbi:hypothetical protein GCM10010206_72660 [Streptomyces cinerochromogenes]|nr:hypothetical protein GCM10010206_72660 [Streptomyces cinerochromogenes]
MIGAVGVAAGTGGVGRVLLTLMDPYSLAAAAAGALWDVGGARRWMTGEPPVPDGGGPSGTGGGRTG